jgi:hypothetical protein
VRNGNGSYALQNPRALNPKSLEIIGENHEKVHLSEFDKI